MKIVHPALSFWIINYPFLNGFISCEQKNITTSYMLIIINFKINNVITRVRLGRQCNIHDKQIETKSKLQGGFVLTWSTEPCFDLWNGQGNVNRPGGINLLHFDVVLVILLLGVWLLVQLFVCLFVSFEEQGKVSPSSGTFCTSRVDVVPRSNYLYTRNMWPLADLADSGRGGE